MKVGADVPPWLDSLEELYESDEPQPPPRPTPLGPEDEPAPYRTTRKTDG